mgnify:CR=1 FL=1
MIQGGAVVHVPRRVAPSTEGPEATAVPHRKEETPLEQYLRGLWETHRFKWRDHVTAEDQRNLQFAVPTEDDRPPSGAPYLQLYKRLHAIAFTETVTATPPDLLKEILKQPRSDSCIIQAELHYAPHMNPTAGEMTPTGHYHRQRTQRLVLRDLSAYVVRLLAGDYPLDEMEILKAASRKKRATAVAPQAEVDHLREEVETLRKEAETPLASRLATAEARVAELERENQLLRTARGSGLTRGGSTRGEEAANQATGETSGQPAQGETNEETIRRLRGERDQLRQIVASLPPLSQDQAEVYTAAVPPLMATTHDHLTELNLWRTQYTGSAATVIADLKQTVEKYREVVGEVMPRRPRGSRKLRTREEGLRQRTSEPRSPEEEVPPEPKDRGTEEGLPQEEEESSGDSPAVPDIPVPPPDTQDSGRSQKTESPQPPPDTTEPDNHTPHSPTGWLMLSWKRLRSRCNLSSAWVCIAATSLRSR